MSEYSEYHVCGIEPLKKGDGRDGLLVLLTSKGPNFASSIGVRHWNKHSRILMSQVGSHAPEI